MKRIFLLSALLWATMHCLAADSLRIGLSSDRKVSTANRAGVAVCLPLSALKLCKGASLTEMAFILYKAGVEDFRLFITTDLDKEVYDYEQAVTEEYSLGKWTTVTLDTPFPITGDSLYIGYRLTSTGNATSYTGAYMTGEEYYLNEEGKWVPNDNGKAAALYALARGENLPHDWAALTSLKLRRFTDSRTPIEVNGRLRNDGLDTLRSIELTCMVGGEPAGTVLVEGLDIAHRGSGSFTAGLPLLPEGNHDVQLKVSKVNGKENLEPEAHLSDVCHVVCNDHFTPRHVLIEMFSTELCSSCPSGHAKVEEAIGTAEAAARTTLLTHHAAFYTDRYTIPASVEYEWFYGDHQLQAPTVLFDRKSFHEDYSSYYDGLTPIVYNLNNAPLEEILADALAEPARIGVELTVAPTPDSRTLDINVRGSRLLDLPVGDDPRLFVYLTEDSLFSTNQMGSGGEYVHNGVIRQCVTDTWGDAVSPAEGYDKSYVVTVPDSLNLSNMHVVAFVANYNAQDRLDCSVYQTADVALRTVLPQSIRPDRAEAAPEAFLQGRTLHCTTECHVTVMTPTGRTLLTADRCCSLSLDALPPGIYLVILKGKTTPSVLKIVM